VVFNGDGDIDEFLLCWVGFLMNFIRSHNRPKWIFSLHISCNFICNICYYL